MRAIPDSAENDYRQMVMSFLLADDELKALLDACDSLLDEPPDDDNGGAKKARNWSVMTTKIRASWLWFLPVRSSPFLRSPCIDPRPTSRTGQGVFSSRNILVNRSSIRKPRSRRLSPSRCGLGRL